jgi:hypothetical protein
MRERVAKVRLRTDKSEIASDPLGVSHFHYKRICDEYQVPAVVMHLFASAQKGKGNMSNLFRFLIQLELRSSESRQKLPVFDYAHSLIEVANFEYGVSSGRHDHVSEDLVENLARHRHETWRRRRGRRRCDFCHDVGSYARSARMYW